MRYVLGRSLDRMSVEQNLSEKKNINFRHYRGKKQNKTD